jgi:hypothetical protein
MKKIFLFTITVIIIFASLLLSPRTSDAVYFASDNVSIHENGKRINDDSVIFVASYKTHSERCAGGVCLIGQQFYPVTIHKAKNNSTLLTFAEFSSQNPYQGDKYDGSAKGRWHDQNKESYLSYLDKNSDYSTTFDPGPSEGGEGCGYPGCIGGRIGDPRSYSFDIASGDYSEISSIQIHGNILLPIRNIIVSLVLAIIVSILIIFFIKKRNKHLSKN